MKKEYISPEIEIQKFSFESILLTEDGDDVGDFEIRNPSIAENVGNDSGSASGKL